ncbi:MAG TPA: ATP-binding protein [Thermohalobaculum sp.]|nr:ATP-binding protein [Thermohalobaculum sp.]
MSSPYLWIVIAFACGLAAGWLAYRAANRQSAARPPGAREAAEAHDGLELLRELPLALVLLDRQTTLRFANAAADALIGPVPEGAPLASVLRARALNEGVNAVLAGGGDRDVAFTHMRAREQRELLAHLRRMPARRQSDTAVVIVIEDRTGPARIERMRRDFVANASHELKTPLAAIMGFLETLQGPARDDPQAADRFLPLMSAQADRMNRLIEDLMALNRIELSEHIRPGDRVDLGPLLHETATALAPLAEAAGVKIEVDLPGNGAVVTGERAQLGQVFVNLIDNAIKYGGSGGIVRVHLAPDEPGRSRMVGVSVTDRGPGVARETIPRLTERFYRAGGVGAEWPSGTGLGLSIVKHILNRHRGDLSIRSELGAGATFTAWLPRAPEAELRAGS